MAAVTVKRSIFLLVLVCSADLIHSLAGCSPSGTSNFIVLWLCTGIPPGWFVKILSTLESTRKISRIPDSTGNKLLDSGIRIPLCVRQNSYMFCSLLACPSSRVVQTVWSDRLSSMSYLVCVRFLPVWLACARESYSNGHYPSEVASTAFVRLYFCGVYCDWFGHSVILSCI